MNWAKLLNDTAVLVLGAFHVAVLAATQNPDLGLSGALLGWMMVADTVAFWLINRLQTLGQDPNREPPKPEPEGPPYEEDEPIRGRPIGGER